MDYPDIEWFALETNRDHSVIFEIAFKYCISDSLVDYDGYDRKEVRQGCILSPCLFNLYAEYIGQNARLHEIQAGIKIAGRNINHLRYADDATIMAESEEQLKSLLMKVKEESETVGLKLNIQKPKIMASGPITSWQIVGETVETVTDFHFLALKSLRMVIAAMKLSAYSLEGRL